MPLQNRVRPDSEIIVDPARGLLMGNRGGRLHDDQKRLGTRRWAGKAWICCVTRFKDRHREVMGDSYTELFFLDEATALAAGHRPCFECRGTDAVRFAELWNAVRGEQGRASAADIDKLLHAERLHGGEKRLHSRRLSSMPDGAFLSEGGRMLLWHDGRLRPWAASGYGVAEPAGSDRTCSVLTPPSVLAVLGAGYRPVLHSSLLGD